MRPVSQRIGNIAPILWLPVIGFILGRMSVEPFSGSGWAWASLVLSVVVLAALLSIAVYIAWMSKE